MDLNPITSIRIGKFRVDFSHEMNEGETMRRRVPDAGLPPLARAYY